MTHPICVDCAIQEQPDPDERDHYPCDACGLVVDALAASPARQLAEQWPSLPNAVQVSSEEGEQLLRAAHDRIGWQGRKR